MTMLPGPVSKAITGRLCRAGQDGDVGDAADVERHPVHLCAREQQEIDERNQRRALAARGDVARAEIGDDRNAEPLGDDRRFADLQSIGSGPAPS